MAFSFVVAPEVHVYRSVPEPLRETPDPKYPMAFNMTTSLGLRDSSLESLKLVLHEVRKSLGHDPGIVGSNQAEFQGPNWSFVGGGELDYFGWCDLENSVRSSEDPHVDHQTIFRHSGPARMLPKIR